MSVSAAELPAMARAIGTTEEVADVLRQRLDAGLQRIAFFIVPSSMAFLALGDVIAAVLYQTGQFKHEASIFVWAILAGSTVGLLASTLGRLYSSTYYALHDTRTPLRFAIIRVALTTVLGYLFALPLPRLLGINPKWGVAGLTASAGIAGWIEFALLRGSLNRRIGRTGLSAPYVVKLWIAALLAADIGWTFKLLLGDLHPIPLAAVVLGGYGVAFFGVTFFLDLSESRAVLGKIFRMLRIA
jgi:putative peptidoglycan lipid II flippase